MPPFPLRVRRVAAISVRVVVEGIPPYASDPREGDEGGCKVALKLGDGQRGAAATAVQPRGVTRRTEAQRRVDVGHQPDMAGGGVVEHGLDRRRHCVPSRHPHAGAQVLAQCQPQRLLPAPRVRGVVARRHGAVLRREDEVADAHVAAAVDEAPILLHSGCRVYIDGEVVAVPSDSHADRGLTGRPHPERFYAFGECGALSVIEAVAALDLRRISGCGWGVEVPVRVEDVSADDEAV